jgi:tetratricopeptide (TPR) repeat protein
VLALQETERALRRFPSEKTEWYWRFGVLKAEILHTQGSDRESLSLLETELPPSLATSDLAVRRKLVQGAASASTQQLNNADRYLAEAESLAKANHPELLGEVSLKKGTVCFWRGDTQGAETDYRQALEIARKQKDSFLEASALSGMGLVTTQEGHYDEANDWNRAALELSRSVGAAGSLVITLGNIGWSYVELGDFESALSFYKQAEEASVQASMFGQQAYWLTSIAWAHQGLHEDDSAETILKKALQLAHTYDSKNTVAQCLIQLSWIALRTGRTDLAAAYTQEASDLKEQGLQPRLVIETELLRGLIASRRGDYAEAKRSLQEVIREPRAVKFQQWTGHAELAKAYADEGLNAQAEQEFRRSLETIEGVRASIKSDELRLGFLFNTIRFYSNFIEFLMSKHRIEDALQVAELSRARTLAEGLGAVSKTLSFPLRGFHPQDTAQRRNAVLLVYWLAPEKSYLWVIAPEKISSFALAEQSRIEALVSDYRRATQEGRDLLAIGNLGEELYRMLVTPAEKAIPQHSRIIVLPDANLYRLNFETLIVPGSAPHYWIEDVTLSTASSLTLLASSPRRSTQTEKNLLLIGNTEQPNADFPALAQAFAEMKSIEQYFPEERRVVLEGKQATPSVYLRSNAERFAYIHFVTHGTASLTHPL